MTDVLDVVGLVAIVAAGFLIAAFVGCALLGACCLWLSWSLTLRKRKATEAEFARRAALAAR